MKGKVIIIEDEEEIAQLIARRFKNEEFEALTIYDGIIALEFIQKNLPDLIILDLMLPGGGINVLERLKWSTKTQNIPVIVLTASKDEEKKKRVLTLGVNAYLEKPYDGEQLMKIVATILKLEPVQSPEKAD